ncbi:MAG: DUF2191 domain-containing protein [Tepidisphaeraceae bacterium]|jgi:hypothetical protein
MRTTLTIDDDIAIRLERLRKAKGASLKSVVNAALRAGVQQLAAARKTPAKTYSMPSVSLGGCRIGSLVSVSDALAIAEGEQYR